MIIGAHSILYSKNPAADRAFLRDVLRLTNVDAGEGWLIFGLPPAEVAVHQSENNDVHEFYLMCDDVPAFVATMKAGGIDCGPVHSMGWGVLTHIMLPGGGKLGVYQPRHARPRPMTGRLATKKTHTSSRKTSKARSSVKATSSVKPKGSIKASPRAKKAAKATSRRARPRSSKRTRSR